MNFSHALEHIKGGKRCRYKTWAAGSFVCLKKGAPTGVAIGAGIAEALHVAPGTIKKFPAYLLISHANGECYPWTASHPELLGNLWVIFGEDDDD